MTKEQKQEISLKRKFLRQENMKWPDQLVPVPNKDWPRSEHQKCMEVWRSRNFLVVIYKELDTGHLRLTANRTTMNSAGMWEDGLTWDDLMELKRQCGRRHQWATEIYPPDSRITNVANLRHLWLLDSPPAYGWKTEP